MDRFGWFDAEEPPEPLLRSTRVGLELYLTWRETGRFQAR